MRQDIRNEDFYYHEDGNVYVFSADNLLYKNNRLTDECLVVENSFINSIQIDSIEDFNMCVNIAKEERVLSWMNAL
jgi:CMP-N-acetylneuraminic acid synthetase